MISKEKILVFPYDWTFQGVLDFLENENRDPFENQFILVEPKGWGYKKICFAGHEIEVSDDFESSLEMCDKVLFRESAISLPFEKSILPKVQYALKKGKKIIYCRYSQEELKLVRSLVPEDKLFIRMLENDAMLKKQIFDIHVPVVFICGMAKNTYKVQTEVLLAKAFQNRGYKVSSIYSTDEMGVLGQYLWPIILYQPGRTQEKIIKINHFVKDIEVKEKPDIILATIPGEIIEISEECTENFGIQAYEIGKAVTPDCVVLNSVMGIPNNILCKDLSDSVSKLFDKPVDYYNCIPLLLQIQESNNNNKPVFLHLNNEYIEEKMKSNTIKEVVHIFDLKSAYKVVDSIISKLS